MNVHRHPLHKTRWQNFRNLIGPAHGAIVDAANRLGKTPGQVSHFGGERPIKNIGDKIAASIEKAWAKSPGWLDQPHHSSGEETVNERPSEPGDMSQSGQLDAQILTEAEKWVRFEEGAGAVFQGVRRAQRLMTLYQLVEADGGSLTPEHCEDIINAARQRQGETAHGRTSKRVGGQS